MLWKYKMQGRAANEACYSGSSQPDATKEPAKYQRSLIADPCMIEIKVYGIYAPVKPLELLLFVFAAMPATNA